MICINNGPRVANPSISLASLFMRVSNIVYYPSQGNSLSKCVLNRHDFYFIDVISIHVIADYNFRSMC